MPRKQLAAVAGRNLLFGPPGTPAPGFGGRGSPANRATTISDLSPLTEVAEMLFEGGDGVNNVAFDAIRGNGVAIDDGAGVIVHGGEQFSHHSVDSIQFNNVDQNYIRITTTLPTYFVFELWFRDTLTDGDFSAMLAETANDNIHVGRGNDVGQHWPSVRNDFNNFLVWELEIDFSGDGLIHQLLEFRDTVAGLDYIVCVDGMPVASATFPPSNQSGGMIQLIFSPSFNDIPTAAASERFGGEMGSFAVFDNGANLTLKDARELYETSALNSRDMLTAPRWFILDSSNVVVPDTILAKQVDLGDVLNDTGIRSGAIPRAIPGNEDGRNTYFELEIIDQGDDATATLIGLRRFAEGGPVGGDSDNPDEAIYLKDGQFFDGANVLIPVSDVIGLESGVILDAQMTAKSFDAGGGSWDAFFGRLNDARAWKQATPPDLNDWIQIDLLQVRTITEVRSQGSPIFNEFVELYQLEFSLTGIEPFTSYNSNEVLTGNSTSGAAIVTNVLKFPFECQFVRLIPKQWLGQPAIRLEYVFAGDQDSQVLGDPITGRVYRFAFPWNEINPSQLFIGDEATWKGKEPDPDEAAGIEFGIETVLDSQMTASSIADVMRSAFEARLNNISPLFWQPSVSTSLDEWLKVDFLEIKEIGSIITQGSSQGLARITAYRLEYNNDDSDNWIPYNFGEVLSGNVADSLTPITNQLIPFSARFVRLIPVAFTFGVNLRLEYTFNNQVSPEQIRSGLEFLNTNFNWGAWARTNGTSGNGKVRLRTKFYEMTLPIPAGYDSWEPQSYIVEATPFGVNRIQSVFDFYPVQQVTKYLFEGGLSTYLLDTNVKRLNKGVVRDLIDGAGTDPTFSGLQLSFASVDSIRWPRTINAQATQPITDPSIHAFELWYRQPDFAQTQCCLFTSTNNSRLGVGRGNGTRRFPSFHNNFNNFNFWESEVDLYGDNKVHQLIEAHSINTDFVVYIDGMPVASGTNPDGGWLDVGTNMILNAEQSNGADQLSRSGGDFGSLISYIGGERLTQIMVRRLYEASVVGTVVQGPVGVESGAILDAQMTASSNFVGFDPEDGRLNGALQWIQDNPQVAGEWLQVDFLTVRTITEVKTQGAGQAINEMVLTYRLEFAGNDLIFEDYNGGEILNGNVNNEKDTIVTNVLIPFQARFVRLFVVTFQTSGALRLEYIEDSITPFDMLIEPRWFILDSVNCTVSAAPAKDLICGSVEDNTGARSGAIPRNGKVYFELEIVVQGDGTGTSNLGPRKLAEPSNVGDFPAVATDGYHTDGQGAVHDSDEVALVTGGVLGTAATGRIFQIAIDWSNGDWWMGSDDVSYLGIGGAGNPSTGANPLPALDINFNWAVGMNILNQFGNNTVRLITADVDLNFAPPTGYVAWEEATDSLFANVVLLVRSNRAFDGQITFQDESSVGQTLTRGGDTIYDNTQTQFGAAASMLFDGSGNDSIEIPDTPNLDFSDRTVEFCIEAWIFITSNATANTIINGRDNANAEEWTFRTGGGGANPELLTFIIFGGGATIISVPTAAILLTGQWYHVAATRELVAGDGLITVYVDGVSSATGTQVADGTTNTNPYQIGHNDFNTTRDFTGHIDSVRVTRGNKRYAGNFTPRTVAFPAR